MVSVRLPPYELVSVADELDDSEGAAEGALVELSDGK